MKSPLLTLALVAVALVGVLAYGSEQRKRGAAEAQVARLAHVADSLANVSRGIDTVYVRDTLRLTQWRTRYVTALDTLRLTDTVAVKEFIAIADSTVKACSVALLTCEQRVSVRDQRIEALEQQIRVMPKPPSTFRVWAERTILLYGGYKLGQLTRP